MTLKVLPVAGGKKILGLVRLKPKDKCQVSPHSTPMSSDEMETSFSFFKTTTAKGWSNPVYDAVGDSELPHCKGGQQSKERAQGRRVPETRERYESEADNDFRCLWTKMES